MGPDPTPYERDLLGMALTDEAACTMVLERVHPDHLLEPRLAALLDLMGEMWRGYEPITLVTVCDRVARIGRSSRYPTVAEISELPDRLPSTPVDYYVRRIHEGYQLRTLQQLAQFVGSAARGESPRWGHDEPMPAEAGAIVSTVQRVLADIEVPSSRDLVSLGEALADARAERAERRERGMQFGLPTGFDALDIETGGLFPGDQWIVAGRPGWGKTAFALSILRHLGRQGQYTGYISCEQSTRQMATRILAGEALWDPTDRRDSRVLRWGDLDDHADIAEVEAELSGWGVWLQRLHGTVEDVCATARRMRRRGCSVIVVDYIQLLQTPARQPKHEALAHISASLKRLAGELDVPVITLSQLNRDIERRLAREPVPMGELRAEHGDRWWHAMPTRPSMADLRDSGGLEADADAILFPFPARAAHITHAEGDAVVFVAKAREGVAAGEPVRVWWDGKAVAYRPERPTP